MTADDRLLVTAAAGTGGVAAALLVHVMTVLHEVHDVSGATRTLAVVLFALGGVVGVLAAPKVIRPLRDLSRAAALRSCGLAVVYAGVLVVAAGYGPSTGATIVLGAAAGACLGAAASGFGGWVDRTLTPRVAIGVLLGGAAVVYLPVLSNAVAEYGARRVWEYVQPTTVAGMRATTLSALVAALVASARLWERARAFEADQARARDARANERPAAMVGTIGDDAILTVEGLDLSYGKLQVLFGVSLHVGDGEAVALLGTNGAGKSSVLRGVFGLTPPSAGRVCFAGEDITGQPAERLVRRGLLQVPGGKGVFPSLTVRENLRMAGYHAGGSHRVDEALERVAAAFPRLAERIDQPAGVLSGGEQQMLALARAWVVRPRLLAIDELTLGLAPAVIGELLDFVRSLRAEGIAVIVVEQSVHVALELTERAYFLERGTVRFEGRTEDLLGRDDLLRSIFFEAASA